MRNYNFILKWLNDLSLITVTILIQEGLFMSQIKKFSDLTGQLFRLL